MFAWLTAAEAKSLLDELTAIDAATFDELDEFHEELIESLQQTVDRGETCSSALADRNQHGVAADAGLLDRHQTADPANEAMPRTRLSAVR